MTTKRLITDSFKVVKRRRREKRERTPPPPPDTEPAPKTRREEELQELRQFDLDWKYGPCTGISRLERWQRADLHGLNPPVEIQQLLLFNHNTHYTHSLWTDYPL